MAFKIRDGVLEKYTPEEGEAKVVIPKSVTEIGEQAFYNCKNLTSITIPNSVEKIGNWTFSHCDHLTSIIIPNSVRRIGFQAFSDCSSLTSIVIPNSVTYIESLAFSNCSSLTSVVIPDSGTGIGLNVFRGCKGLADRNGFIIKNGVLHEYCGNDQNVTIPDSVRTINCMAFEGRLSLQEIIIPDSVEEIRLAAFKECSLRRAVIGTGVKVIPSEMFLHCGHLEEVRFGSNVTEIGDRAFQGCIRLENITIPNSVTVIGRDAFHFCPAMKSITIPENVIKIGPNAFGGWTAARTIILQAGEAALSGWATDAALFVERLPLSAVPTKFKGNAVRGFARRLAEGGDLPEYHDEYMAYIKKQCKKLFPETLKEPALLQLMLREKLIPLKDIEPLLEKCSDPEQKAILLDYQNSTYTADERNALTEKRNKAQTHELEYVLRTGKLPVSELKKIWSTKKLEDGTLAITSYKGVEPDMVVPEKIGSAPITVIEAGAFTPQAPRLTAEQNRFRRTKLHSVTLPEGIRELRGNYDTSIPDHGAFYGCEALRIINIPESVRVIGHRAFYGCTALEEIEIPGTVKAVGDNTFRDCTALKKVIIGEGVEEIDDWAFNGCKRLEELVLPASLQKVGRGAFYGCTALQAPTLSKGSGLTFRDGIFLCRGTTLLSLIGVRAELVIPSGITEIEESAIAYNETVTSIVLPEELSKIGENAFSTCKKLTSVALPTSLTTICKGAFQYCYRLKELEIPSGVTDIDPEAFYSFSWNKIDVTIRGVKGSYAEQYADDFGLKFKPI